MQVTRHVEATRTQNAPNTQETDFAKLNCRVKQSFLQITALSPPRWGGWTCRGNTVRALVPPHIVPRRQPPHPGRAFGDAESGGLDDACAYSDLCEATPVCEEVSGTIPTLHRGLPPSPAPHPHHDTQHSGCRLQCGATTRRTSWARTDSWQNAASHLPPLQPPDALDAGGSAAAAARGGVPPSVTAESAVHSTPLAPPPPPPPHSLPRRR